MDKDFIIAKGDTAKYRLIIEHADFDMRRDDFKVVLRYGLMGKQTTINKADMYCDEDGEWYMVFDTDDMVGQLLAACHYYVPDTDAPDDIREELDYQYIAFVTDNPCPHFNRCCMCPETDGHVTYKRVWRGDVRTKYLNLRTSEGEPIVTADGEQVRVRKEEKDIY
jgi:hypothetical protein